MDTTSLSGVMKKPEQQRRRLGSCLLSAEKKDVETRILGFIEAEAVKLFANVYPSKSVGYF